MEVLVFGLGSVTLDAPLAPTTIDVISIRSRASSGVGQSNPQNITPKQHLHRRISAILTKTAPAVKDSSPYPRDPTESCAAPGALLTGHQLPQIRVADQFTESFLIPG